MADRDVLADAKEAFKQVFDAESEQRKQALDDIRFARLGEQWPVEVKRQRELEGRPCLTLNRMPAFCKQVINDARQNRPAIKCHPVGDGADHETAEILDGLIRNIEYTSNADVAYDTALENSVYGGYGYFLVRTDYASDDSFDLDLRIEPVFNQFSVFGDPNSSGADSADWNTAFVTDLITEEEYKRRWPGADVSDWDNRTELDSLWFHDERVQIAEWWTREPAQGTIVKLSDGNIMREDAYLQLKDVLDAQFPSITVVGSRPIRTHKVSQRIVSGSEVLETNPWKGRYIPVIPVYGETVNVEGKRTFQSLVHFAKDSQRQYNFWRTATTELVALAPKAPFIGAKGSFDSDPNWRTANTVSHAYLEYDPVPGAQPPQRQPFAGPPAGAIQEALSASDDMKNIMGIHEASLGMQGNEVSGRAILARQREGDVSTYNFIDNLSRGIRHLGRVLVDLIPEHYDAARVIRCIKEDGSSFSVPVNQPVIPAGPQPQNGMPGNAPPAYAPVPPQARENPQLQGLIKTFSLTTGKYDVTVEAGPSFTTRREEAATQMMEFLRVLPASAPLIGDLFAKNLDWPGADEIAKRLQAMLPPQVQGQNPQVAGLQKQLQQQDGMAKQAVGKLQQELMQLQEKLANKSEDIRIKDYEAVTGRIIALADAVKVGVQLTQDAEGNLQAVPLMKPMDQDQAVQANLRHGDQTLEAVDLALREREQALDAHKLASDHAIGTVEAHTKLVQAVQPQMPSPQVTPNFSSNPNPGF